MANPTDPSPERFRTELDNGEVVEADGSMVTDPATGAQVPAVLLRMTAARAHTLAHVLTDWSRAALIFAALSSSEGTERELAWTLEAGAAALGEPGAARYLTASPEHLPQHNASRPSMSCAPATRELRQSSASPSSTRPPDGSAKRKANN